MHVCHTHSWVFMDSYRLRENGGEREREREMEQGGCVRRAAGREHERDRQAAVGKGQRGRDREEGWQTESWGRLGVDAREETVQAMMSVSCVWCVVCGAWCVVCGVWCVVCTTGLDCYNMGLFCLESRYKFFVRLYAVDCL